MLGLLLALTGLVWNAEAINGKCRGLVLGGGSDRGPFQAGAIAGLIEHLPAGEATWDVINTNGIGAINGLIIGQVPIGQESSIPASLTSFWYHFKKEHFYKSWFGGMLVGYYTKMGLYNNSPLQGTIKNMNKGGMNRFMSVGVVDLVTTNYYSANTTLEIELFLVAVEASLNDHGMFPYTEYKGHQFTSGDAAYPVDVDSAVNDCVKLGYTRSQIILDIVTVTGSTIDEIDPSKYNTIDNVLRYTKIVSYHNVVQRLNTAITDHPLVTFRSLIQLEGIKKFGTVDPYFFFPGEIKAEYTKGYNEAVKALAL